MEKAVKIQGKQKEVDGFLKEFVQES